ncbi:hypothetical protein QJU83_01085 [Pasteurella skyensis]|uniref:hypothetical protein n=1 Tax=Phocoenobacter skyensis TaxID=97481 RepID=UPI0027599B7F|nr:hypothetical protein [Pasteurella skyensis]MDP8176137.1 hypothetical protein [Pasteurella skyensis]MDP8198736.1 hypothetical protein [Pasteurella skyensis]
MKLNEFINVEFNYLSKYNEDEINAYLDYRDSEEFEIDWLQNSAELNECELTEDEVSELEALREFIFEQVFNFTSNGDLSAYISDDFELIGINLFLKKGNVYAENLLNFYKRNKLPK